MIFDIPNIWKVSLLYVFGDEVWDDLTEQKTSDTDHIWKVSLLYVFAYAFSVYQTL